jgi:hypothetical protein
MNRTVSKIVREATRMVLQPRIVADDELQRKLKEKKN